MRINISGLIAKLREHGIKVTPQRLAICNEILSRKDHPTADMLYSSLKKSFPTLSVATLYKTLQLLKKLGFIQEVESIEGHIRFDPNMSLHINLICLGCGDIQDASTKNLAQMWTSIVTELGIESRRQVINIYYNCEKCKSR